MMLFLLSAVSQRLKVTKVSDKEVKLSPRDRNSDVMLLLWWWRADIVRFPLFALSAATWVVIQHYPSIIQQGTSHYRADSRSAGRHFSSNVSFHISGTAGELHFSRAYVEYTYMLIAIDKAGPPGDGRNIYVLHTRCSPFPDSGSTLWRWIWEVASSNHACCQVWVVLGNRWEDEEEPPNRLLEVGQSERGGLSLAHR